MERYQSPVCAIACSGTGDVALSQDLAQETFLAAWTGPAALREPAKLKAWLAGIARNPTRNARRRHRETDSLEAAAEAPSPLPTPLEEVLESASRKACSGAPSRRSPRAELDGRIAGVL